MIYIQFLLLMSIVGGVFFILGTVADYKRDRRQARFVTTEKRWWT